MEDIVAETNCAVLVFDLEDRNSFSAAKRWHRLLTSGEEAPEGAVVLGGLRQPHINRGGEVSRARTVRNGQCHAHDWVGPVALLFL